MALPSDQLDRFRRELDALIADGQPIGLAVSGGPDSMALLLLAAEARLGLVRAATVDHRLRPEAADEADYVASVCANLDVPHDILKIDWSTKPTAALQERARIERYAALDRWVSRERLTAVATGHHADDQAETLLMRLARGVGIKGLAAMRPSSPLPGSKHVRLIRPLLGWRRSELQAICASAGVVPIDDPSNADEQYERVRMRRALADGGWLDAGAAARSASLLGQADTALDWAAEQEWQRQVQSSSAGLSYVPGGAPAEIVRRIVLRAILQTASEGDAQIRGRELDQLLAALRSGGRSTLRGVLCSGGETWSFIPAPNRTRRQRQFD